MITVESARLLYEDNDATHGFDHVLRVLRLAERLGAEEGADAEIVRTAALLHDISRGEQDRAGGDHAALGAARARQILAGHPADRVERVVAAIAQHRFRVDNPPTSLEAEVLYDADKLDAMGAIGVARAYAYAGENRQHLWAEVDPSFALLDRTFIQQELEAGNHTPVHEYVFKLSTLKDRMITKSGSRLAAARHAFMVSFFEQLAREMQGID
jgi:uncharacterized protein